MKFNLILTFLTQLFLFEAFRVDIKPYSIDCYHHRLQKHEVFLISFSVTEGGDQLIDFELKDQNGNQLQKDNAKSEGYYHYNATEAGSYKYCFHNGPDVKRLSLHPHSYMDNTSSYPEEKGADHEKFNEEFYKLEGLVDQLQSMRDTLNYRDYQIEISNKSISKRIFWWAVFQVILLGAVCIWQVVQIKKFFEVRRLV